MVADAKGKPVIPAVKVFNEDLLCQHGSLEPQKSVRKLIPFAAWEILQRYFPEAREFKEDDAACPVCANADREEQEAAQVGRVLAGMWAVLAGMVGGVGGSIQFVIFPSFERLYSFAMLFTVERLARSEQFVSVATNFYNVYGFLASSYWLLIRYFFRHSYRKSSAWRRT